MLADRARLVRPVVLSVVGVLAACPWALARERGAEAPWQERSSAAVEALSDLSETALRFHQHITALADPFFEGRSADTRGNAFAAEYVRFYFERAGLTPGFAEAGGHGASDPAQGQLVPDAAAAQRAKATSQTDPAWFQSFEVPGEVEVKEASASLNAGERTTELKPGEDFNALGFSGDGTAEVPVVFVGYAIAGGPDGFSSLRAGDDLSGKIAVVMRYEPMDEKGKSKWSTFNGWSRHAALMEKTQEVVSRGAAGLILINPPGADDPRARKLEDAKGTRFGKPIGVPAVMLSNEGASKWIKQVSGDGQTLRDLRRIADLGGHGPLPLGKGEKQARASLSVKMDRARMATRNVGALLPGKGALASELVVIGAHYDHVGYGFVGGSNPGNQGKLHPGADDNASGTAGLILLSERLKQRYDELPSEASARSVLFLAFSAEEMGLLGAEHFVKATSIDPARISAMINMDMIGRVKDDDLEVGGMGSAAEFDDLLKPLFEKSGLDVKPTRSGMGPSDHAVFHRAGTPVLFFFTGTHQDYHTPTDLPHKINAEGAARVLDLVEQTSLALVMRPGPLTFQQTSGPQMARGRAKVRLGVMPGDYSGDEPGVLVGEVYEETSAAKAGILKGDRIVRWGGEELADAGVMMQRLVDARPGDVVEVVVVRDGKEVTLPVTLLAKPEGQ